MVRRKKVKDIADPAFSGGAKLTVNKCRILTANSLEEAPGESPINISLLKLLILDINVNIVNFSYFSVKLA